MAHNSVTKNLLLMYFVFIALMWWLGLTLFPDLLGDQAVLFLTGGTVAGSLIIYFIFIEKGATGKSLHGRIITGTYKRTVENKFVIVGFFVGGFILGTLSGEIHGQPASILVQEYSVFPFFAVATKPIIGFYSYALNAPIEDFIFILAPLGAIITLDNLKLLPFKDEMAKRILIFASIGLLATVAHMEARTPVGCDAWYTCIPQAFDFSTFIVFGTLGIVAKEFGFFAADALHIGLNGGLVTSTLYTVVGSSTLMIGIKSSLGM